MGPEGCGVLRRGAATEAPRTTLWICVSYAFAHPEQPNIWHSLQNWGLIERDAARDNPNGQMGPEAKGARRTLALNLLAQHSDTSDA